MAFVVLLCPPIYVPMAFAAADSEPGQIAILASHRGQPYDGFIEDIQSDLAKDRPKYRYANFYLDESDDPGQELRQLKDINLLITVGTQAAVEAGRLNLAVPTLATLIPRISFLQIQQQAALASGRTASRSSAVFLDQPLERQLDLIRIALPGASHLGVIVSAVSRPLLPQLEKSTTARGLTLVVRSVTGTGGLGKALLSILDDVDALLALPDPEVHNRFTAANILLAAYRKQVPVIGYSRAYVEAGALLAVYSTPQQIARQVAQIVRASAADTWRLPAPQYPHEFEINVNKQVAHSLGLKIPSENELRIRLLDIEAQDK